MNRARRVLTAIAALSYATNTLATPRSSITTLGNQCYMRKSKVLDITETTEDARTIFQRARTEYNFSFDVFTSDDERMQRLKRAVVAKLEPSDQNILILYCEVGSVRKTAEMLGVSVNTFMTNLRRIRKTIKDEMRS